MIILTDLRFNICKEYTTLMREVDNRRGCVYLGTEEYVGKFWTLFNFAMSLCNLLKILYFFKNECSHMSNYLRLFKPLYWSISEAKVTELCPTLCDPMAYTVLGILQARILEWGAFSISRGSSRPRDWTQVTRIASGFFTVWAIRGGGMAATQTQDNDQS